MFHSLARKATAAARPVKISGVARVRVSRNANCDPAAPLITRPKVLRASAPLHITSSAAKTRLAAKAPSGASTITPSGARSRGSSRMAGACFECGAFEALAGHHQPELLDGDSGAGHRRRQMAAIHHGDAVGER